MIDELYMFLDVCISSLPLGSLYCLLALSFVLIFRATKLLNLCQGELMMLGAYISYSCINSNLSFVTAILVAIFITCIVALPMEKFIVRRFMGKPIFVSIMVTLGLGIMLRGIISLLWGVDQKVIALPFLDEMVTLSWIHMNYGKLIVILIGIIFIASLELFFRYSRIGTAVRSTASNTTASMMMGVNVGHIFSLSWLLASIVSVVTGVFISKLFILEPTMSQYGFIALSVLVLGGVDSIKGAIVAGYAVGLAENLSVFYIGGDSKSLAGFIIMFAILMFKPYGLFGIKKIERV